MGIETQKLRSCPMHLKLLNKLKVAEKALSCRKVAEQLVDKATWYVTNLIERAPCRSNDLQQVFLNTTIEGDS